MKTARCVLLALFLASAVHADDLDEFDKYPVKEKYRGPVAKPDVSESGPHRFRTVLRNAAAEGPNFAGHYTLARWGCGGGCISWAIIDAVTGKVWMAPVTVSSPCIGPDDVCQQSIDFKPQSELLIVRGARNEQGAGTYYYRWHDDQLSLVRALEATVP